LSTELRTRFGKKKKLHNTTKLTTTESGPFLFSLEPLIQSSFVSRDLKVEQF